MTNASGAAKVHVVQQIQAKKGRKVCLTTGRPKCQTFATKQEIFAFLKPIPRERIASISVASYRKQPETRIDYYLRTPNVEGIQGQKFKLGHYHCGACIARDFKNC